MKDNDEVGPGIAGDETSTSDDDLNSAGMAFVKRFSHIIFGEGVFRRSSHEERVEFAKEYARAPALDVDEIKEIMRYSAWSDQEKEKVGEDPILGQYARVFFSTVIKERSVKAKKGIAIFTLFGDHILDCLGHALNEGVTEMGSSRSLRRMAADGKYEMDEELRRTILAADDLGLGDGAYFLAVKAAEQIEAVVGERILMRAYFGDFEDFQKLVREVDEGFGEGAFWNIVALSDEGRWREVFKILKAGRPIQGD